MMRDIVDPDKNPPHASFELNTEWAKSAKNLKPGQVVRIVLLGTVQSLSLSSAENPEKLSYDGHLGVAMKKFSFAIDSENQIAELFREDNDE